MNIHQVINRLCEEDDQYTEKRFYVVYGSSFGNRYEQFQHFSIYAPGIVEAVCMVYKWGLLTSEDSHSAWHKILLNGDKMGREWATYARDLFNELLDKPGTISQEDSIVYWTLFGRFIAISTSKQWVDEQFELIKT